MVHSAAIAIGVVLLVVGYIFFFKSLNEHFQMQHEINSMLAPARKFEPMFWSLGTWERFRQLQKEVLPDSIRPQRFRRFRLIGFACFMSGMLLLVVSLGK
jgi:hypothetical protein